MIDPTFASPRDAPWKLAMVMDTARLADLASRGEADLIEVFSSIQGEGLRVGERHLFVRFVHCDIHCRYCDTPHCHRPQALARFERSAGLRAYDDVSNPVPVAELARRVDSLLGDAPHRAVSFTGGEPLLHPWAIRALAPMVRSHGAAVLLETDGNLPEVFEGLRDVIDVLSLDWKVPTATGEPARYEEHRRMLELVAEGECYLKFVFTQEVEDEEVIAAARTIRETRPSTPLILQPCTPRGTVRTSPTPERTTALHAVATAILEDVRVIPQIHPILSQP